MSALDTVARWCVQCDALWLAGADGAERPRCTCETDADWVDLAAIIGDEQKPDP